MDIIAISVCVNYSDILKHMLDQNSKFFKVWYIITSPKDTDTIRLIEEKNISNIQLLLYTDFYKNAKFNKGGAIKFAQEYINIYHKSANILILDSDIKSICNSSSPSNKI